MYEPTSRPSRAGEIVQAVHARPGITRAELAADLGLSSGTASDLVAALIDALILSEGDPVPAAGRGRPTRPLRPHDEGPLVAVAAISHERWEVEAVAVGGDTVERHHGRHRRDSADVLTRVGAGLTRLWETHAGRIRTFAVSVPGTVSGTRLVQASNLGWQDLELSDLRPRGAEGVPLLASNDATYSAIGEWRRGAGQGHEHALHLLIDSGIGGALIDSARVATGAHGMAGEFGHMPFGIRDAACRCGARGCWNTELDGLALADGLGVPLPEDEVTFSRSVVAAAGAGVAAELGVVRHAASALGRGIAGLVNALDPELVVLSGLAGAMLGAVPESVEGAYRAGLMATVAAAPPHLVAGVLGDRGPLVGAMETAFAPVLARPLP